jgi:cysteine desulfurase / selenocysteine lyase
MPPWQGGGNMIADVTFEKTIYQGPPARFEAGTGNIADAVGLGAALDYSSGSASRTSRATSTSCSSTRREDCTVPGLRLIGTAREKAGVLSFVSGRNSTEDVGKALDQEGIAVRAGHHCAQPILRRFGLESTVRRRSPSTTRKGGHRGHRRARIVCCGAGCQPAGRLSIGLRERSSRFAAGSACAT